MNKLLLNKVLLTVSACAFIIGCSTSQQRSQKTNLWQDLNSKDKYDLRASQRTGNIYQNFSLQLKVDAFFLNQHYKEQKSNYLQKLAITDIPESQQETTIEPGQYLDIILVIYHPQKPLKKANFSQYWQQELNYDNQTLNLAEIIDIKETSTDFRFISYNSKVIDRWSTMVLFRYYYPAPLQSIPASLLLDIKGLAGSTQLQWENVDLAAETASNK